MEPVIVVDDVEGEIREDTLTDGAQGFKRDDIISLAVEDHCGHLDVWIR